MRLVDQVGRGITAVYRAGLVHRDLKPPNLFRAEQDDGPPRWKILDFGISKLVAHGGTLTAGKVVGTPLYMAPEQAGGLEVGHRADLYSLAAVAYRCLTGYVLFREKDPAAILYSVVHRMPVRPSALASLHPDVDRLVAVALAKTAANRLASASELTRALSAALVGRLSEELRSRGDALIDTHPWHRD